MGDLDTSEKINKVIDDVEEVLKMPPLPEDAD